MVSQRIFSFQVSFNTFHIKLFSSIFRGECHEEKERKGPHGGGRCGGWVKQTNAGLPEVCVPCEAKSLFSLMSVS